VRGPARYLKPVLSDGVLQRRGRLHVRARLWGVLSQQLGMSSGLKPLAGFKKARQLSGERMVPHGAGVSLAGEQIARRCGTKLPGPRWPEGAIRRQGSAFGIGYEIILDTDLPPYLKNQSWLETFPFSDAI